MRGGWRPLSLAHSPISKYYKLPMKILEKQVRKNDIHNIAQIRRLGYTVPVGVWRSLV